MVTNNSRDKGRKRRGESSSIHPSQPLSLFLNRFFPSLSLVPLPPFSPRSNLSALYPQLATVRVLTRNSIIKCPVYLILNTLNLHNIRLTSAWTVIVCAHPSRVPPPRTLIRFPFMRMTDVRIPLSSSSSPPSSSCSSWYVNEVTLMKTKTKKKKSYSFNRNSKVTLILGREKYYRCIIRRRIKK